MKTAFDNLSGDVIHLPADALQEGVRASRESPRKRMILPIHRVQAAPVQRMMNFLQPGTYVRPHKHPRPGACESLVVLSGSVRFFTFDAHGTITSVVPLEAGRTPVLDLEDNVWHAFVVTAPDTVLFECKMGPYDAVLDKVFAPWSPEEFSPGADAYRQKLEQTLEPAT